MKNALGLQGKEEWLDLVSQYGVQYKKLKERKSLKFLK